MEFITPTNISLLKNVGKTMDSGGLVKQYGWTRLMKIIETIYQYHQYLMNVWYQPQIKEIFCEMLYSRLVTYYSFLVVIVNN